MLQTIINYLMSFIMLLFAACAILWLFAALTGETAGDAENALSELLGMAGMASAIGLIQMIRQGLIP